MKCKFFTIFFLCSIISISISCESQISFSGSWLNSKDACDEIIISSSGKSFVFERNDRQFPAKVLDDILEIYAGGLIPVRANINSNNQLILQDEVYDKSESQDEGGLNCTWRVFDEGSFRRASLTFENDTVSIYYGSPVEIIGTFKNSDNQKFEIFYSYEAGSISFGKIAEELSSYIKSEFPIANKSKQVQATL